MKKWTSLLVAVSLCLSSYLLATYPVWLHPATLLPGAKDALFYPWNLYQFQHLLTSGQNPFFTTDILAPYGINLLLHAYNPITDLIALLIPTTNFILKQNLILPFGIILSALITTLLTHHVLKALPGNTPFLAPPLTAIIFATSPFVLTSLIPGHYPYTQSFFLPLTLLLLIWWHHHPTFLKSLLISTTIWASLFNEYYQGFLTLFLAPLFLLANSLKTTSHPQFKQFVSFVFLLLLPLPIFLYLFLSSSPFSRTIPGLGGADICRANLARFLLPSSHNLWLLPFPQFAQKLESLAHFDSPSVYLGIFTLSLALIGLISYRRFFWARLAGLISLTGVILAAGPQIKLGSLTLAQNQLTPYWWLLQLPLIQNLRCPIRYATLIMLGLSLLAALGLKALAQKLSLSTITLIFLFTVADLALIGLPFTHIAIPTVYSRLAQTSNHLTLLEFPSGFGDGFAAFGTGTNPNIPMHQMYFQTLHHHPRIGGHASRISNSHFTRLQNEIFIADLWRIADKAEAAQLQSYSPSKIQSLLQKYQLGYLILWPVPHQDLAINYTRNQLAPFIKKEVSLNGFVFLQLNPQAPLPSH